MRHTVSLRCEPTECAINRPDEETIHVDVGLCWDKSMRGLAYLGYLLAVIMATATVAEVARAENAAFRSSYVTPFPDGDVYNVAVVGDSLAEGTRYGLRDTLNTDRRVRIAPGVSNLSRITFNTFENKLKTLRRNLVTAKTDIAVVILGVQDRRSMIGANGRKTWLGSRGWRNEYSRRVDKMMKTLKNAGMAIYWVGLPNMRSRNADAAAQIINDVIRERAYLNGVKYIDIYASFSNEQGGYSAFGPDMAGNVKRLRWRDGMHFTGTGYAKVAHYVAREMRRDVALAKAERTVPLAGSEGEQAAIRAAAAPAKEKEKEAITGWQQSVDKAKQKVAARREPQSYFLSAAAGEQKEANGRVNLNAVDANGRPKIVSLEILRPAIPASVVALVTRKQSRARAAQIGDTLVDETANGLNIMSTVTPASEATAVGQRRKLSLAQSPFFRVLVKGERMQSRAGRVDDFAWPRPALPAPPKEQPGLDGLDAVTEGGVPLPPRSPFRPRA